MPWITMNGHHVLVGEGDGMKGGAMGGGNEPHPAMKTGDKTSDKAVAGKHSPHDHVDFPRMRAAHGFK